MKSIKSEQARLFIAIVLAFIFLLVDAFFPLGYADWGFYVLPLVIVSTERRGIMLFAVTILCSIFIVIGYYLSPPIEISAMIPVFNRIFGLILLWVVALLLNSRFAAIRRLQKYEIKEARRLSEERFKQAVIESPFPLIIHAEDGSIITVNKTWIEITGYTLDQIPTIKDWAEKAFGEKNNQILAEFEQLYSLDHKISEGEHQIKTSRGEIRIWQCSSAPLGRDSSGRRQVISTAMDITERKKAEEALKTSEKRLELLTASLEEKVIERTAQVRNLAKEVTLTEQKERQRLSKILHDDLQQVLFSAIMHFDLIEIICHENRLEILENFHLLKSLVKKATEMSKTLALELNPPVLYNEGLDASLGWLSHFMKTHYGLQITTDVRESFLDIPEDQRILVVQLVRELFQIVIKHSGVHEAKLSATRSDRNLLITVEDSGKGFDTTLDSSKTDEYLLSFRRMKSRLHLCGGELKITSHPSTGTRVQIIIPGETT